MNWISIIDLLPEEGIRVLTIDTSSCSFPKYKIDYRVEIECTLAPFWIWACIL
jgi:hypothetical protein